MSIIFEKFNAGDKLDQSFVDKINRNNLLLVKSINEIDPEGIRNISISSFVGDIGKTEGFEISNAFTTDGRFANMDLVNFEELNSKMLFLKKNSKEYTHRQYSVSQDISLTKQTYDLVATPGFDFKAYGFDNTLAISPSGWNWGDSSISVDIRYELDIEFDYSIYGGGTVNCNIKCKTLPTVALDGLTVENKFYMNTADPTSDSLQKLGFYIAPDMNGDSGLVYSGATLSLKNMVMYVGDRSTNAGTGHYDVMPFVKCTGIVPMSDTTTMLGVDSYSDFTVNTAKMHVNVSALFWR